MAENKLVHIGSIKLDGETIKHTLSLPIGGSEKTILIFESGRVLIMPVHKACPVQPGTIQQLEEDFQEMRKILNAQVERSSQGLEVVKIMEDLVDGVSGS